MISSPCYPYPVNDKSSSARRTVLQPHIYSPSEPHGSPRITMYPQLHATGCHSPSYVYPGYEQYYYSKEGWPVGAAPSSWSSSYYPFPRPSSSSLPKTAVNPKMTILPLHPVLVSDIDTPSSLSSHSDLTPSSPFTQHDMNDAMEFDEFECEDEEDYFDSDFADEMEGVEDMDMPSPLYGASAPQLTKSTSALAGALGDAPSPSYDTDQGVSGPADRRLSASVPGYASASYRSSTSSHERWPEKAHSPVPLTVSPHTSSYPSQQYTYTHRNYSTSTFSLAPGSPSMYDQHHIFTSSSLAGAFASSAPPPSYASRHAHAHAPHSLPILQPQPIRPIPPIPIADLTSSADENGSSRSRSPGPHTESPSQTRLSPLPLLCQPVSDAVRYQLKEPTASGGSEDDGRQEEGCYESEPAPESACADLIAPSEATESRFAPQGMEIAFLTEPERHRHSHHHQQNNNHLDNHHHHLHHTLSAGGAYSVVEKLYSSCVSVGSPMRW